MVDKKLIDELISFVSKNREAFEVSEFDGDIFWLSHIAYAYAAEKIGFFHMTLFHRPGKYLSVYDKSSFSAIGHRFFDRYGDDPDGFRKRFFSVQRNLFSKTRRLSSSGASISDFKAFIRAEEEFSALMIFSLEALEHYIDEQLRSKVDDPYVFAVLTTPLYTTYVKRQSRELLDAVKKLPADEIRSLKKKDDDIKSYTKLPIILKRHLAKWDWSFLSYGSQESPGPSDLLRILVQEYEELGRGSRKGASEPVLMKRQQEKRKLLRTMPADVRKLISFFDLVVELRDQRKASWLRIMVPSKRWLRSFAERNDAAYDDAMFLTDEEIMLLPTVHREEILRMAEERRKGCVDVLGFKGNHSIVLVGRNYEKIKGLVLHAEDKESMSGIPASSGSFEGKVRVIRDKEEFGDFKEGEILVASHTTPDYIMVMKKASAILTERGGITSHAAIVSRELGIPCIVGIRNVTGILKTGDLVKVDAGAGIVKRIKHPVKRLGKHPAK